MLSLGTGGPNRLGQSRRVSQRQIHELIARALDLGVNLFDTSSAYENSEMLLGNALQGVPRERYFLSSKIFPWQGQKLISPEDIRRSVERSLRRLRVQEIDLFQLHRVTPEKYEEAREWILPELQRLRQEGKIRFLGISESSTRDPEHRMLGRALQDNLYDTVMVAYNPANSSAAKTIFPLAGQRDVGVICMAVARPFISRSATARLQLVRSTIAGLFTSPPGNLSRLKARISDALRDVAVPGRTQAEAWQQEFTSIGMAQMPESAYAFALQPAAVASVLTGTTDPGHLESNIRAVQLAAQLATRAPTAQADPRAFTGRVPGEPES